MPSDQLATAEDMIALRYAIDATLRDMPLPGEWIGDQIWSSPPPA